MSHFGQKTLPHKINEMEKFAADCCSSWVNSSGHTPISDVTAAVYRCQLMESTWCDITDEGVARIAREAFKPTDSNVAAVFSVIPLQFPF